MKTSGSDWGLFAEDGFIGNQGERPSLSGGSPVRRAQRQT